MSEQRLKRAQVLMAHGEYGRAHTLIAGMDHPARNRWLAQIDQRIARRKQHRASRGRLIGLAVVAATVVLIGLAVVLLNARSVSPLDVQAIPTLRILPGKPVTVADRPPVTTNLLAATEESTPEATDSATPEPTETQPPYRQVIVVPLDQPASPEQVLRLTHFEFEKTTRGIDGVVLEIENVSDTAQSGIAWYLLSQPGSDQPWVNPAYSSEEQAFEDLAAGESVTLTFDGMPSMFAAGTYSLSAWIHQIDATGARVHQDGMGYSQPIAIAPPLALEMSSVEYSSGGGQTTISLELTAANNSPDAVDIAFAYTISGAQGSDSGNAYEEPKQMITLEPGESRTNTYSITLPLAAGSYNLTAWLYRYNGETSMPVAGIPNEEPIVVPE